MSGASEAASSRGRSAAHDTNTRYRLSRVIEYRAHEELRPDPSRPGMPLRPVPVADLVGDCGHVLQTLLRPQTWEANSWANRIAGGEDGSKTRGLRKRCSRCPAPDQRPIPVDHCQYTWETEQGERVCSTRARFRTVEWGGQNGADLCTRHHNHLVREGYIRSAHRYTAAELEANRLLRESQLRVRELLAANGAPSAITATGQQGPPS